MPSLKSQIRQRWLDGQTINATRLAERLNCSSSTITMERKKMEDEGYAFEKATRVDGDRQFIDWTLLSLPDGTPVRQNGSGAVVPQESAAPAASRNGSGGPSLPTLGATVQITLLSVDEHGVISIGIREGKKAWLCELRGQSGG